MIREEHIENLLAIMDSMPDDACGGWRDSIAYAVEKLKQESCYDCISRQEAILQIQRYGVGCFDADEFSPEQCERFVINKLNELSPVIPHQKIGRWIFVDKANEHAHCSECDYGDVDLLDGRPHNYCPSCGAKMICRYHFCPNCGAKAQESGGTMTKKEALELIAHKLNLADNDPLIMTDTAYNVFKICADALKQTMINSASNPPTESGHYLVMHGGTNLIRIDEFTTEADAKEIFGEEYEAYTGWDSRNVIKWMYLPKFDDSESF